MDRFEQLLAAIKPAPNNQIEGLEPWRSLLSQDSSGCDFLESKLSGLKGKRLAGVSFVLAEHYREQDREEPLKALFSNAYPMAREYVLNALWDQPGSPAMGATIVNLACLAAGDPVASVRVQAASVIQNQCDWGVDVSPCLSCLRELLKDRSPAVRMQANYAVGNLAKKGYPVGGLVAQLRHNMKSKKAEVKESAEWALGEFKKASLAGQES